MIVLVGGGLTGALSWVPHEQKLAATHEVMRVQPIHVQCGLDNKPLPAGYSVRTESEAIGAQVGDRVVDLVAWSNGAFCSLDFALNHPDRVRTLTLIEPPAFWVLDASGTIDEQSARERDELRALYATMTEDVTEAQLAKFVAYAGLVPPGKRAEELPPWPSWVEHRRSLRTGDVPWRHTDTAERLRAFDRPVLLVKGTGSSHFLYRILDGLALTLPHARMIELPGGHAPQIVAFDAFLAELLRFIA
jgi:pimeloyl-ACP methyl ester carboxylesterase